MNELTTSAEKRALAAESLPAFSAIKLLHIKRSVAELLRQIGANGIFDQYTRHDITHIDAMLESLEWLVPDSVKSELQPADWLLLVLAIYFHDLALLVTTTEFENREQSTFREFCETTLFGGDDGVDYRAKVDKLSPDRRERFLYQEFVRTKHAERIKHWITGKARDSLGVTPGVVAEIDNLFRDIDPAFRRDLGFVCESHHLSDLNDFRKYKTRQPYGPTSGETANLHYCAVLLRATDLLHITRDRTPSIAFRTLNPSDPISQEEWAKQMAVRAVRPKLGRDKEGNVSPSAPQDTVEIHAFFTATDGFFGLTSYLSYAEKQLRQCHGWVEASRQLEGVRVTFPWKHVDDTAIETDGFLSEPFEFSLDQAKILDLLTGHTLYNETSVVLRELAQNSLDAVRLQCLMEECSAKENGRIIIHWNTAARILTIEDNGTGMSQAIIENHLLKVGSSRYQDAEFKKQFPNFFPISRFGIGVLSCFMVADSVEITTVHPDDDEARQLTLKSVHGRYLIRLLDKERDTDAATLGVHGTRIRLTLRASAKFDDPIEIARKWILIPECNVAAQIDSSPPLTIGYGSPKDALREALETEGYTILADGDGPEDGDIRVKELSDIGLGLELAIAVRWSAVFKEWGFLCRDREQEDEEQVPSFVGTCVEGIRVQFRSPGFEGVDVIAIANTTGRCAPRTNVARSTLEETEEGAEMLGKIYELYMQHVRDEIAALHKERSFSITWSVQEAGYLVQPFFSPYGRGAALTNPTLARQALGAVPLLLVERDNARVAIGLDALMATETFWTVEGNFYESAEALLREVPTPVSLRGLIATLQSPALELPLGVVLCRHAWSGSVEGFAFRDREPVRVSIHRGQRRIDVEWGAVTVTPRWKSVANESVIIEGDMRYTHPPELFRAKVATIAIPQSGATGEIGVRASGTLWIFAGTLFAQVLEKIADGCAANRRPKQTKSLVALITALDRILNGKAGGGSSARTLSRAYEEFDDEAAHFVPRDQAIAAVESTDFRIFDPLAWKKRNVDDDDDIAF